MFTLRVFFLDLLAFVPHPEGMWVLLPDGREGGVRHDGTVIERHFPVVLFDTKQRNESDWPTVKARLKLEGDRIGEIWALEREEVRISSETKVLSRGIEMASGNPGSTLPSEIDRSDFSWIPNMEIIAPESAQIDPECLAMPVQTEKLISRMWIPGGRLNTCRFAGRKLVNHPAEVIPFEFKADDHSAARGPAHAIADLAVVEIDIEGECVSIEAVPFGSDNIARSIKLHPCQGAVDILLANLSPVSGEDNFRSGPHFELYYSLAKEGVNMGLVPFAVHNGSAVAASIVNGSVPLFLEEVSEFRPGGISRQICTFAKFRA